VGAQELRHDFVKVRQSRLGINVDAILYGLPPERELLASGRGLTLGNPLAIFAHNLSCLGTKVGFVSKRSAGQLELERLVDSGWRCMPYRFSLTYTGTMFELHYQDIELDYICSVRHSPMSSFFLHRGLRRHMPEPFRSVKAAGLTTSLDTND